MLLFYFLQLPNAVLPHYFILVSHNYHIIVIYYYNTWLIIIMFIYYLQIVLDSKEKNVHVLLN